MARPTEVAVLLAFLSVLPCADAEEQKPEEQVTANAGAESAVQERLAICHAFFGKMSRRTDLDFTDTPLAETFTFLFVLAKVGVAVDFGHTPAQNITLKRPDVPIALALTEVLTEADLDWTIGVFPKLGANGTDTLKVYIADPTKIKAMNEKYPEVAKAVAEFRERMRAEKAESPANEPERAPAERKPRTQWAPRWHPDELAPEERVNLCQNFCLHLERKVTADFVDTPLQELLTFIQALGKSSINLDPKVATAGSATIKVTYRCKDMPCGLILDDVLARVGLDWTIYVIVHVDTPERIKELNQKYPEMAKVVADFRERMRAQIKAQQTEPAGDRRDVKE